MRLTFEFFSRPAVLVAKELLGKILVHGNMRAAILETEAYLAQGDAASHVQRRRKSAVKRAWCGPNPMSATDGGFNRSLQHIRRISQPASDRARSFLAFR